MAIEGLEVFEQDNFSQGLDRSDDKTSIAENASPDLANVRFFGQSYYSRPGYRKHLNQFNDNPALGLHGWIENDSLIVAADGKIYREDPDNQAYVEIKDSLDTSAEMGFEEYLGDIYYGNGVDAFGRIQHTAFTTTEPAGAPKGNILKSWAEKMWVAGHPDNPRTLYYSRTALAANPERIYDFSNEGSGSELVGKEGNLTGLETTRNALVVFKDSQTYYIRTFDTETAAPQLTLLSSTKGAVGRKAYTAVGDKIYFFTGDEVRLVDEFEGFPNLFTEPISKSIRRYIKEELAEDQSDAIMTYNAKDNLLKLWVTAEGANNPNICLVYHFDDENRTWTVDTGKPASQAVTFKNKTYWSSQVVGQLYEDEAGLTDDIGLIKMYRWSKKRKFYSAKGRKKIRRFMIAGKMASNTTATVKIYGDGYLKKEITITSDDFIGAGAQAAGQIGVDAVAVQPVGGVNVQVRDFEKIVGMKFIARYVEVYVESSTLGGYFQQTDERISYIPLPRAAERHY